VAVAVAAAAELVEATEATEATSQRPPRKNRQPPYFGKLGKRTSAGSATELKIESEVSRKKKHLLVMAIKRKNNNFITFYLVNYAVFKIYSA
jgi:hypothetical protein